MCERMYLNVQTAKQQQKQRVKLKANKEQTVLTAVPPCDGANTAAGQSRHKHATVFASRQGRSLVNAARAHIIRLWVHDGFHSVKVGCIFCRMPLGRFFKMAPLTFAACPFFSKEPLVFPKRCRRELRGRDPLGGPIHFVGPDAVFVAVTQNTSVSPATGAEAEGR